MNTHKPPSTSSRAKNPLSPEVVLHSSVFILFVPGLVLLVLCVEETSSGSREFSPGGGDPFPGRWRRDAPGPGDFHPQQAPLTCRDGQIQCGMDSHCHLILSALRRDCQIGELETPRGKMADWKRRTWIRLALGPSTSEHAIFVESQRNVIELWCRDANRTVPRL